MTREKWSDASTNTGPLCGLSALLGMQAIWLTQFRVSRAVLDENSWVSKPVAVSAKRGDPSTSHRNVTVEGGRVH